MKKVLVFGTFDILHPGHDHFLKKAKEHGEKLVVVLARDVTIKDVKGKAPYHSEVERLDALKKHALVDEIFLGYLDDKYKIIEEIKPDIICLGYDQTHFTETLEEELEKRHLDIQVIRIKESHYPEKYKSSKLRAKL